MTIERQEQGSRILVPFTLSGRQIDVEKVTTGKTLTSTSLGPIGTFSEEVALEMLDGQAKLDFSPDNGAIVQRVDRKDYDLGVVAFENSTEGTVIQTLKAIIHTDLEILGEHTQQITQNLFGTQEGKMKGRVHSHPQGFAQTRKWLADNIPNLATIDEDSTAKGVRIASELDEMGIGTIRAGEVYNIPLIQEGIEDNKLNFTRFWMIGRGETQPTGNDRTWIICTLKNAPGTLLKMLEAYSSRRISIDKIDTPPLTMDHYYFFVAIDGHKKDPIVKEAIEEAEKACWKLKVIGSFEKSTLPEINYEPQAYEKGWIPESERPQGNGSQTH